MPNNEECYLEHHGIKDQRWGVRNGPPWPLSRFQLSRKEKKANGVSKSAREKYGDRNPTKPITTEKAETRIILAPAKVVYDNRTSMTNKELQDYLNRVNLERQVADLAAKQYAADHPVANFIKTESKNIVREVVKEQATKYTKQAATKLIDDAVKAAKQNSTT